MEVKIDGKLIHPDDMSHEDFIHIFINAIQKAGIFYVGESNVIEDIKLYNK